MKFDPDKESLNSQFAVQDPRNGSSTEHRREGECAGAACEIILTSTYGDEL
jgi:hypothetical protein